MTTLTHAIESKCRAFARDMTALVTEQVMAAFAKPTRAASSTLRPKRSTSPLGLSRGEKRSPEDIDKLTSMLLVHITLNPGQGIEALARGMKRTTRELNLPIKKLLREGSITTVGEKRARKYHPAKGQH